MLLQFKVIEDGSLWSCDTDKLRYARLARSLVDIAENPSDEPAVEEFGELKSMNPIVEAYRMEGRERTTEGPGCGLTSIVIAVRILDDTVDIGVRANVPISDVVNIKPIRKVVCEVLGQKAQ